MRPQIVAPLAVVLVAGAAFYGVSRIAISQPAEPTSTPEPGLGLPPNPEYPVIEGEGVDLRLPLSEPLELPIAGYKFLIPAGAIVSSVIAGPPIADVTTGERIGEPIAHPHYVLISREDSSVKIDNETGEIFEWDVKPVDVEDFEPLRNPR